MDLGLDGKIALVTGASAGIGRGIAAGLAAEGSTVAISSRSRERIEKTAAEIGARPYVFDSADLKAAPGLLASVEADLGPIDVLVTNTGGPPPVPSGLDTTRDQWEAAYRELVLSPMALIQPTVRAMGERGFGRVLNISSSAVHEPIPSLLLSTAHRSALLATFKQLSREVAGQGVTLNTILPGRIATDRLAKMYGSIDAAEEVAAGQVPAGRLGTVYEIAAAAAFLCSVPAGYVTGVALRVDGGLTQSI